MSLTSSKVAELLRSGAPVKVPDGRSMYLIVRDVQQGYYVGQYRDHANGGRFQTKGLGRAPDTSLKVAREAWEADRSARRNSATVHPVTVAPMPKAVRAPGGKTFGEASGEYVNLMASRWTGGAVGKTGSLYTTDARTPLARLTWSEITDDVIAAHTRDLSARGAKDTALRIKAVREYQRTGKIKEPEIVEHHKALPGADVPAFYKLLDISPAAKALAFTCLTAVRIGDVLGTGTKGKPPATWGEIKNGLWTIAGDVIEDSEYIKGRSKNKKDHVVPLSAAALTLLGSRGADDAPLFPDLSYFQVYRYKEKLGLDFDIHGLRTSFRTWCGDHGIDRDHAEMSLSHPAPNASESEIAYSHSKYLELRRPIMEQWARFVAGN
jgi:integrase